MKAKTREKVNELLNVNFGRGNITREGQDELLEKFYSGAWAIDLYAFSESDEIKNFVGRQLRNAFGWDDFERIISPREEAQICMMYVCMIYGGITLRK